MSERFEAEEAFHNEWATSVDLDSVMVDASFESCTAPEGRRIVEWLGDLRGKQLLDVGCGLGEAAVYFAKQGAEVTATDLSGEMLALTERVAERHGVRVATAKGPAETLPFDDASFDVVYAGNVLHHGDTAAMIDELHRLLRPGGVAVTWDPLHHNPLINVYRRMATQVRTEDEHPLRIQDLELFRRRFRQVDHECFWFFTLLTFVRFFVIERVHPNKERYWKKVIAEADRLEPFYSRLERWDRHLLGRLPWLGRYCWNVAVRCVK
ncbi:MAG: class I SAM-dependent methyltransferase [Acidobacteriota bacterium]